MTPLINHVATLRAEVRRLIARETVRGAAEQLGVGVGQLRGLADDRDCRVSTLTQVSRSLAAVTPLRPVPVATAPAPDPRRSLDPAPAPDPRAGLDPVGDRRLAELLARLIDEWESADEFRRGALAERLADLRGGGAPGRVAAWIGWRVIDPGDAGGGGSGDVNPGSKKNS